MSGNRNQDDDESIGARVKRLREASGMDQMQLADRIGTLNVTVSKWETGKQQVSAQYLPKLASALNVSMETLVSGEPEARSVEEKAQAWDQLSEAVALLLRSCPAAPTEDGNRRQAAEPETEPVPGTGDHPPMDR